MVYIVYSYNILYHMYEPGYPRDYMAFWQSWTTSWHCQGFPWISPLIPIIKPVALSAHVDRTHPQFRPDYMTAASYPEGRRCVPRASGRNVDEYDIHVLLASPRWTSAPTPYMTLWHREQRRGAEYGGVEDPRPSQHCQKLLQINNLFTKHQSIICITE